MPQLKITGEGELEITLFLWTYFQESQWDFCHGF